MRDRDPTPSIVFKTELPTRLIARSLSGMENEKILAGGIVLRSPDPWLPNFEEFDVSADDCIGGNVAGHSVCAVGQVGADDYFPFSANTHPLDPVPQTGNAVPAIEVNHHP
jgi:hypothetical protein